MYCISGANGYSYSSITKSLFSTVPGGITALFCQSKLPIIPTLKLLSLWDVEDSIIGLLVRWDILTTLKSTGYEDLTGMCVMTELSTPKNSLSSYNLCT